MNPKEEADNIKLKNIIDMAVTFTAMVRVFEKGSKSRIVERLEQSFSKLSGVSSRDGFESIHVEFCEWFVKSISTASKNLKNKSLKKSHAASYGHAAKVFDIAVKVYVHYCNLPDRESAFLLVPFLHGAVDNPIMKNLKAQYPKSCVESETIESVGKAEYELLQALVSRHIRDEFKSAIFPVQYDDIMWHRLNRRL
jgi:hypothetical protein